MSKQVVPLNLFRLTKLTENENETIIFCRSFGLFPSEIRCPNCNILLEKLYHFKNRNATTFHYRCNRRLCHRKGIKNSVTLCANTWFNEARISIQKSLFSRTVRSGRLIFSLWRVVGCLLVCGQLFQLFTQGGSPGSNFKY